MNSHGQIEFRHLLRQAPIKRRHRLRLQGKSSGMPVAGLDKQLMIEEIELDLERPGEIRNGGSREPSGTHIKRDMPGVIDPGTLDEPNFADDLSPHMQGRESAAPRLQRKARPSFFTRIRQACHKAPPSPRLPLRSGTHVQAGVDKTAPGKPKTKALTARAGELFMRSSLQETLCAENQE